MARATFAMGCYWGAEDLFAAVPGVTATEVGFMGGRDAGVTEAAVFAGEAGHAEVVRIDFDPAVVAFEDLLAVFWVHHDPAAEAKPIVRSAVFCEDEGQRAAAEASRPAGARTEIAPVARFWRGPDKDQQYLARQRAAEAAE